MTTMTKKPAQNKTDETRPAVEASCAQCAVRDRRKDPPVSVASLIEQGLLTKAECLHWQRTMHEIRFFEDTVYELLGLNEIKGASHLYAGEEAVAVGAIAALERGDVITSTHRGHGHCGAVGNKYADSEEERQDHWNKMMAELMGKAGGYCRGRGGSMHIADVVKCNNLGATGIVGGNQAPAVGAAWAEQYKKSGRVVLCFFGDGATNTGSFHESVNMAAALKLPIVFIIENNLYGMSVPFHSRSVDDAGRASNVDNAACRALAYGIPTEIADGQDPAAMFVATREAVRYAREGRGPVMIEAKTYRWYGHSRSDPKKYRSKEEEAHWRERDPLKVWANRLTAEKLAGTDDLAAVEKKADESIRKSVDFARKSPSPKPEELADDVYVVEPPTPAVVERDKFLAAKVREAEAAVAALTIKMKGKTKKEIAEAAAELTARDFNMNYQTIVQSVVDAQREAMKADPTVFTFGEDIGLYGGAYGATKGLLQEFGAHRVVDTAISEAAIAGAAVGAALRGLRPIAEIMYVDFITLAMDQLVHNAAYNRYMFGGKAKVPMVLRTEGGVGRCIAAHHSESLEAWLVHVPGLYVVMPSTPYDYKGLLLSAIESDNPVVFIEHKATYGQVGPVPQETYRIPLGVGDVKRVGKDVTIAAYSRMAVFALAAAEKLAAQGVEAEVIDPRTLKPLDVPLIAESVRKTGRLITVSEGFGMCGMGKEIAAQVMDYTFADGYTGFDYLDARPVNLAAADVPPPMSEPLENASIPSPDGIVAAALNLVGAR
jgi:2-oxoisovalerate dehydrogenase E1 component